MTAPIGPDVPYPQEIQIYFVFWGKQHSRKFGHCPSATTGKE